MDHEMFPLQFNRNIKKPIVIPLTINNSDIMKKLFSSDINLDSNSLPLTIGNKPASMKCKKISTLENPFDFNLSNIKKPTMKSFNPFSSCKKKIHSFSNNSFDSNLDKMLPNSIFEEKKSNITNLSKISFNIQHETIITFFISFLLLFSMSTKISFLRYVDENNNYKPNIFRVILLSFLISVFFLMQSSIFLLEKINN